MKGLLFTYALTYGGAAVSLINPFYGMLVYVCFAIIKPEAMWYWSVPAGNYSRTIAIGLILGWAINGFGNWNFGKAKATVVCLVAWFGWAILSGLFAPDQQRAYDYLEPKFKIVLPFVIGLTLVNDLKQLKMLAWVILCSQGYVALELNMTYYGGYNRLADVGFGGMDNNCQAIAMVTGVGLALFLGMNLGLSWWARAICFAFAALMAHCVFFSFSRGAMVSLAAVGAASFFLIEKKPWHLGVLLLGLAVAIRMAGPDVRAEFMSSFAQGEERDASSESRLDLWKGCLTLMAENPILGVGPHHFPPHAPRFGFTPDKEAHSTWLQVGAEMGIPSLLLLLGFYLTTVRRLWTTAQEGNVASADPFIKSIAQAIVASILGFIVAAQFVTLEGLELPYYIVLVGAGTIKILSTQDDRNTVFYAPQSPDAFGVPATNVAF